LRVVRAVRANSAMRSAKLGTGLPLRLGLCATLATLFFVRGGDVGL
jgi:hypothetical protein